MRTMAALIGSGVMDRYPRLRIGTLGAGHSWLPFWMARLDKHAESIKAALPPLPHKPNEYVLSGRYFQSIEIPEDAQLTKTVIAFLGEDILMYASDSPTGRAGFPNPSRPCYRGTCRRPQAHAVLGNAVKFYARYGRV